MKNNDYKIEDGYWFRDDGLEMFSLFSLTDLDFCYEYSSRFIKEKDIVTIKNDSVEGIYKFCIEGIRSREEFCELFLWFSRNTRYKPLPYWWSKEAGHNIIGDWSILDKPFHGVLKRVWFKTEDVIARKDLLPVSDLPHRRLECEGYYSGSFRVHVPAKDIISGEFRTKIESLRKELQYKAIWNIGPEEKRYCEKWKSFNLPPEYSAGCLIV